MVSERFVVREVEGWGTGMQGKTPTSRPMHLSVVVLDSAYCYQVIAEYKTEGVGRTHSWLRSREAQKAMIRGKARDHAARLNRLTELPLHRKGATSIAV